jgi:hypothetical protein
MDQRLSVVTLGVADLARARRFYERGLGWVPGSASEEIVFFQIGGSILSLFPREALAADAGLASAGSGFGGFTLGHVVAERHQVDEVMETARRAGAKILKPAQDAFWGGYSGYFAGPDGHAWEVAWNPAWGFGPDGAVRLRKE